MTPIEKYFIGERLQCSIGIGITIISIAIGIYFMWYLKTPFSKGIAFPFFIISALLFSICATVAIKSPKDIERVSKYNSGEINSIEKPRMDKVMKNFKVIKIVEISLLIICIILFFIFRNNELLRGIFVGIAIQSIILFGFDFIAASRGKIYWEYLQTIT